MSDKTIRKGDLVMVVRGHSCTVKNYVGKVFEVTGITPPIGGGYRCTVCGEHSLEPNSNAILTKGGYGIPIPWLIKINPPAKDTETEREKEAV